MNVTPLPGNYIDTYRIMTLCIRCTYNIGISIIFILKISGEKKHLKRLHDRFRVMVGYNRINYHTREFYDDSIVLNRSLHFYYLCSYIDVNMDVVYILLY